jgi:hypothetical protein
MDIKYYSQTLVFHVSLQFFNIFTEFLKFILSWGFCWATLDNGLACFRAVCSLNPTCCHLFVGPIYFLSHLQSLSHSIVYTLFVSSLLRLFVDLLICSLLIALLIARTKF